MKAKIKDMSLAELKAFIDETVDKRLEERFGDPDVGLEVKPEIIEKIRSTRLSKSNSPATDAAQRLGLKWRIFEGLFQSCRRGNRPAFEEVWKATDFIPN